MKEIVDRISRVIAVVTDWLLIIVGALLIIKALLAIDVPVARYLIVAVGVLFLGAGFWYRNRRKRRSR